MFWVWGSGIHTTSLFVVTEKKVEFTCSMILVISILAWPRSYRNSLCNSFEFSSWPPSQSSHRYTWLESSTESWLTSIHFLTRLEFSSWPHCKIIPLFDLVASHTYQCCRTHRVQCWCTHTLCWSLYNGIKNSILTEIYVWIAINVLFSRCFVD